MDVSVVIRTLNESRWLASLLDSVASQKIDDLSVEVVIVDSGSTDATLDIAERYGCRIAHIAKEDFTFGRSLNLGCSVAQGDVMVFVSGHCIPANQFWLLNLVLPLRQGRAEYTYGRQVGYGPTKYSERQHFKKYFPHESSIPQVGIFCNNANAALLKSEWEIEKFDEELTGLEDMELAKRLVSKGKRIGYVADAPVHHIHEETWSKVKTRYEREAIALRSIMPEVHVSFFDFVRYFLAGIMLDLGQALQDRVFLERVTEIFAFRFMQYWGTYCGNNEHRKLSRRRKEAYFYPR